MQWWLAHLVEPWGDLRDDFRAWAAAHAPYTDRVRMTWPYCEIPLSADEYREQLEQLEREIAEAQGTAANGKRRENLD